MTKPEHPASPVNERTNNSDRAEIIEGLQRGALIGIAVLALVMPPMGVASINRQPVRMPAMEHPVHLADFGGAAARPDVAYIAHWVTDSRDNKNLPFVIVDKKDARVYVFHPDGRLRGESPVLLGSEAGDETVEGVGQKKLTELLSHERTTSAGRFVAEPGHNAHHENVVWIDYKNALSMHRVLLSNPAERRQERLDTPTPDDNRISAGCVNVPVPFFESVLAPAFEKTYGIVYVLPESRPVTEVFPAYDALARVTAQRLATAQNSAE